MYQYTATQTKAGKDPLSLPAILLLSLFTCKHVFYLTKTSHTDFFAAPPAAGSLWAWIAEHASNCWFVWYRISAPLIIYVHSTAGHFRSGARLWQTLDLFQTVCELMPPDTLLNIGHAKFAFGKWAEATCQVFIANLTQSYFGSGTSQYW